MIDRQIRRNYGRIAMLSTGVLSNESGKFVSVQLVDPAMKCTGLSYNRVALTF